MLPTISPHSAAASVQGGATSLRGRLLWADTRDSEPSSSAVSSPSAAASTAASIPETIVADETSLQQPAASDLQALDLDVAYWQAWDIARFHCERWHSFFVSLLTSKSTCGSFLRALQTFMSVPVAPFACVCAELIPLSQPWCAFLLLLTTVHVHCHLRWLLCCTSACAAPRSCSGSFQQKNFSSLRMDVVILLASWHFLALLTTIAMDVILSYKNFHKSLFQRCLHARGFVILSCFCSVFRASCSRLKTCFAALKPLAWIAFTSFAV